MKNTRERVYQAIVDHIDKHGMSPTIRELQAAVGLKSPSNVRMHLDSLVRENKIIRHDWKSRGIEVPGAGTTTTARAGVMIAERILASAEPSREVIGDVLVPGDLIVQLKRWVDRTAA